jgi:hypothetical protein
MGRHAFVSWFLWRRWVWLAVLASCGENVKTYRLLTAVVHIPPWQVITWLATLSLAVAAFAMVLGYGLARFIWYSNERRYVREVLVAANVAGTQS